MFFPQHHVHPTDHQLLLGTHKGHEPSARLLWERLGVRLVAYARALLRDRQAAEDAVQGAFLRVISARRAQIDAVGDPVAWLVTLTRREAVTQLRAHRRDLSRQAAVRRHERIDAVESAGGESLAPAVGALPRRQREVVVLKHIAGLTFDQIATALAINRNTAAARYRAGLDRLRSGLLAGPPREPGGVDPAGEHMRMQAEYELPEVHHG